MIEIKIILKDAPAWVTLAAIAARHGMEVWRAYIAGSAQQRVHGGSQAGAFQPKMTRKEAALILGVSESAVENKIKEAHRRVMVANHPDTGGSNYLAAKINEAKDVMMGKT